MVNRDIQALDQHELILKRPHIYIGSVDPVSSSTPVMTEDGMMSIIKQDISVGMYKIMWEIVDNAIDELKRVIYEESVRKGRRRKNPRKYRVKVSLLTDSNLITVSDNGNGFKNPLMMNVKSGMINIETAYVHVGSGTNYNDGDKGNTALVGVNGVGATLANIFSDRFAISSTNNVGDHYTGIWETYNKITSSQSTGSRKASGTEVSFIPRKDKFGDQSYDAEILRCQLILRAFALTKFYPQIQLSFFVDGKEYRLDKRFIPEDNCYVVNERDSNLLVAVYPKTDFDGSFSVVNGTLCTGVIDTKIRKELKVLTGLDNSPKYLNTMIFASMPPDMVAFGDQNKTKFTGRPSQVDHWVDSQVANRFSKFIKSSNKTVRDLIKHVKASVNGKSLTDLDRKAGSRKAQINSKYFPPSKSKQWLFVTEGESALGSLCQCRDPKSQGAFATKGKIKNCISVKDIRTNDELMNLISILGLKSDSMQYDNFVLASDADVDGSHIQALFINMIYRMYKHVIDEGRLYILKVPIGQVGKDYFFSLDSYHQARKANPKSKYRYLKGLGSLEEDDWNHIMPHIDDYLIQVVDDEDAAKYLDIAFNSKPEHRKAFLNNSSTYDYPDYEASTITISHFMNTKFREYALYSNTERAIPDAHDCLTPVRRFVVKSAPAELKGTMSLIGNAIAYGYQHGDASLAGAIAAMTRTYDNSTPLISGSGYFGNSVKPEPASPRYTKSKRSPDIEKFTHKYRNIQNPDSPVKSSVPIGLGCATLGIGTGFQARILPRDLFEVEKYINGDDTACLDPHFPDFNGVMQRTNSGSWLLRSRVYIDEKKCVLLIQDKSPFVKYTSMISKLSKLQKNIDGKMRVVNNTKKVVDIKIYCDSKNIDKILNHGTTDPDGKHVPGLMSIVSSTIKDNIILSYNDKLAFYRSIKEYLDDYKVIKNVYDLELMNYDLSELRFDIRLHDALIKFYEFMMASKRTKKQVDGFMSAYDETRLIDRLKSVKAHDLTSSKLTAIEKELKRLISEEYKLNESTDLFEKNTSFELKLGEKVVLS